jgi:NADH dehydrogenase
MKILLIGGSGFVGTHLAERLYNEGHYIHVPTRRYERARHLLVLPTLTIEEADIHDEAQLERLMANKDAVINLVGVLQGGNGHPYGPGFARAHVELPKKIVRAAQRAGIKRVLHMSALQADGRAPSGYLRSKAAGEAAAFAVSPAVAVTVFRPSVIFGEGDSFLSLFARLQALFPVMPLACPDARFQPVWVDDVATAFATSLTRQESFGQTYDLCGPRVYTLRELVAYAGRVSGHPRPIFGLPPAAAWLQAALMEWLPGAPLSRDNLRSMQVPSVCEGGCTLPFGLIATPLEDVAPNYLSPAS